MGESSTSRASASITARPLAVVGGTGASKVYDGLTSMGAVDISFAGTGATDSGLVLAQTLTATGGTGTYGAAGAGSAKAYAVTGHTWGGSAERSNYSIPGGGGATITGSDGLVYKRPLNVSLTGVSKVYDGTTAASGGTLSFGTPSYAPVAGDVNDVTVNYIGTYSSKNVSAAAPLTLTSVSLSGTKAGNYHVTVDVNDPLQKPDVRANAGMTSSTGAITQRDSVTWVGGSTGNWFGTTRMFHPGMFCLLPLYLNFNIQAFQINIE
jgi:hypothetical protein